MKIIDMEAHFPTQDFTNHFSNIKVPGTNSEQGTPEPMKSMTDMKRLLDLGQEEDTSLKY